MTEEEVVEIFRSYNDVQDAGDGSVAIKVELEDGRYQIVFVTVAVPFISIMSAFAEKDAISATQALSLASIFGLCELNMYYGLRTIWLLDNLDENEIINMISWVATQADAIESKLGGNRL